MGAQLVTEIVGILTSAFTGLASSMGSAFGDLAQSIFLTTTGTGSDATTTLSVFGILICVFAAISLGLGLVRWALNFVTSFGQRNR